MARSLGTLTLDLIAKIGGFTAGLTQAERAADKSAKEIERSLQQINVAAVAVGTAIGSVMADGIRAAANAFPELIDQAAQFADIADKTGGSAEGFANFAVSAKVAGVEMETIATASTKLSKGLFGVDEESKGAAQGIQALGLNIKELQGLKPDEQLKAVANAFGNFADGANKAAVAQQIFGKNGAELLKFFKDYVDAGGDVNILTAEMIQKADDFADAQTRLRAQLSLTAAAFATEFIDPLNALIKVVKDAVLEIYNMDSAAAKVGSQQAIRNFAEDTGRALAGAIDYVRQSVREFQVLVDFVTQSAQAMRQMVNLNFADAAQTGADFRKKYGLDEVGRKVGAGVGEVTAKSYTQAFNEELARGRNDRNRALLNAVNYGTGGDNRPQLKAPPAATKGGGGGSRAERISEAERYLQSLQKQLEKTQELTTQEQVLQDIQMGRLGKVTDAQKEQLLSIAGQIDASKQLAEQEKARLKAEQEAAKAREALLREGQAMAEANRSPIEIFIDDNQRAKELLDAGAISADTYSRQIQKIGDAFTEAENPIKEATDAMDEFTKNAIKGTQDAMAGFFESLVDGSSKSFKDVADNFAKMLAKMAAEALAADITKKLFGAAGGGEGSGWVGALSSLVSGARANGGPVSPNSLYRVNERGPEVFQSANGDQYLMTGNKGGNVLPNAGGFQQTNNFVVQGTIDRRTETQLATNVRRQTNTAAARFA